MRNPYLGLSLVIGMTAGTSLAVPITVNNPSFEESGAGVPQWDNTGGSDRGHYAPYTPSTDPPGSTYTSIPDGTQVGYLYNAGARIYQTTQQTLTPGRVYNLSAYMGQRNDTYQPRTIMSLMPESEIADFLVDPHGASTDHFEFRQVEPEDIAPAEFKQFNLTFDTNSPVNAAKVAQYAGQKMVITFYLGGDGETDLDLVQFSATEVPEPTALALAAPAAMALLRRRRV